MKKIIAVFGTLLAFMMSCSSQTEPINYGKDNCGLCKMTIMEKEYACELVTTKGKVFKFDDISCLVKYLKASQTTEVDYAFIVVNNFKNPKSFVDVKKAAFLSGEGFTSPMRGDLAAFSATKDIEAAKKKDPNIKVFSWKEVLEKFNK